MENLRPKCPICGGPENRRWLLSHSPSLAVFLIECYSGEPGMYGPYHLYIAEFRLPHSKVEIDLLQLAEKRILELEAQLEKVNP